MPMAVMSGATSTGPTESDLHAALGVWGATFASLVGATADQIRASRATAACGAMRCSGSCA